MTKLDLILVRHGQSTWNEAGRWQGQADPELSELGLRQAQLLGAVLQQRDVVAVWASDLMRARETGSTIAGRCGVELRIEADLREIDVGDWSGSTRAAIGERDPEGLDAYYRGVEGWSGGERYADLDARTDRVIERLAAARSGTVVLVTHGGTIRSFITGLMGLERGMRWRFAGTAHGAATTFTRSPHGWRMTGHNVPPAAL